MNKQNIISHLLGLFEHRKNHENVMNEKRLEYENMLREELKEV
jgi:hypothetical protein